MENGDIVEVSPVTESQQAFKGKIVRIRSGEMTLRPIESGGGADILGININRRKSRFRVLTREGNRRENKAYSVKSVEVIIRM